MSISACMQARPLVKLPESPTLRRHRTEKAVVVVGATGTGKSRLSVDLATLYGGEVVNSDKIQVYKGLDMIANKVSAAERRAVNHHLLDFVDPEEDFTAEDYVFHATLAVESISRRGRLPIIAGGSMSFVKALVASHIDTCQFCILWVDVNMHVLRSVLSERVDKMVERGLVDEASGFYAPDGDYGRGIRRAIGVPEMDEFFRKEGEVDGGEREELLEAAIEEIKVNTHKLACNQVKKILTLRDDLGLEVLRLNATAVGKKGGRNAAEEWRKVVAPSVRALSVFV